MAKPWARIEQNYINHPKFLALDATSICLWLEGKNYCDMHLTDGLIPRTAMRTFRFASRRSIDALGTSAGPRPDGGLYAPLWERHDIGFKMHDYLDHNPCRDEAIARFEQKEAIRKADRDRKKAARAAKAARHVSGHMSAESPSGHSLDASGDRPENVRSISVPVPEVPPVAPLVGGRITRAERKRAEEIRRLRFGCFHEPRCRDAEECVQEVVLYLREKAAAS